MLRKSELKLTSRNQQASTRRVISKTKRNSQQLRGRQHGRSLEINTCFSPFPKNLQDPGRNALKLHDPSRRGDPIAKMDARACWRHGVRPYGTPWPEPERIERTWYSVTPVPNIISEDDPERLLLMRDVFDNATGPKVIQERFKALPDRFWIDQQNVRPCQTHHPNSCYT